MPLYGIERSNGALGVLHETRRTRGVDQRQTFRGWAERMWMGCRVLRAVRQRDVLREGQGGRHGKAGGRGVLTRRRHRTGFPLRGARFNTCR